MNACMFCGSAAVQWPDFATDYVKGYMLCEYHMGFAVAKSLKVEFKDKKHFDVIKYNKMEAAFSDFMEDLLEENSKEGPMGEYLSTYEYCPVAKKFYDDAHSGVKIKPLVDPSKQYLDDAQVDEWISNRLKILVNEKRVYRCSAQKKGSPDNRCINRTYAQGDLCDKCIEKKIKNKIGGLEDPKIISALAFLRSTNAGNKVAA